MANVNCAPKPTNTEYIKINDAYRLLIIKKVMSVGYFLIGFLHAPITTNDRPSKMTYTQSSLVLVDIKLEILAKISTI